MEKEVRLGRKDLMSFLRLIFFDRPSKVEKQNYPTYFPLNFGCILTAIDHCCWIIIFYALGITPLYLFNIISVTMWLSAIILNRRGFHSTALVIGCIELLSHQALCVIIIGWGTGFQYFLFMIPMLLLLLPPGNTYLKLFLVLFSWCVFVSLDYLFRTTQPQMPIGILEANIMNYANLSLLFFIFPLVMVYSSSQMLKVREELRGKNQALINIENSLKKYLPIQLVNTIKSRRQDAVPETERKKLTIFFSDIKGFTEITESLEAEELSSLLNEYLTEMTIIAHKWGGTVDKFIGDAIMIFFGAPDQGQDKDNAINCVSMAVEMQIKMKELQVKWYNEGFENPLQIRIGISTGTSTVGSFGAKERLSYTVIGRQVNIAARLENICRPGEVMISHPTWALISDEIPCSPGKKVSVKGVNREIMTYRVTPSELSK